MTAVGIYKSFPEAEFIAAKWAEIYGDEFVEISFNGTHYLVLIPTE